MRPDPDHEELFALRFRDEALHSASLIHTNIATVFDYGEDDGLAFLVMELVDGQAAVAADPRARPAPRRPGALRDRASAPWRSASRMRPSWSTATSSRPTSWSARTAW